MTRLTRDDVASKAGVEPAYVDHLVDLGLITPAQDDSFSSGDVFRARWIRSLEASGLPLDGMAAAVRDGSLSFNYLDASAFERFGALTEITMQELSEAKGLPMGLLSVIREAVGFPEANPDDLVREEELAIAEAVAFQLEYGFNPTVIERLLRVYGDSLRRITETETDAYRSEVTERLLATGTWGNAQNRHLTWGNAQISGLTPPHPVSSVHVLPRRQRDTQPNGSVPLQSVPNQQLTNQTTNQPLCGRPNRAGHTTIRTTSDLRAPGKGSLPGSSSALTTGESVLLSVRPSTYGTIE